MPETNDLAELSAYFTACEALAEALFDDLSTERRSHIAMWSAAVMDSLRGEKISTSDLHLMLGTLAGIAVHQEYVPDGVDRADLRDHGRNLMIGAFEHGCDGKPLLDFKR